MAIPLFHLTFTPNLNGYVVSYDFSLTMSAPAGKIYYTTDGEDPRPLAKPQQEITAVVETAVKRVLVPTGPVNDDWKGGAAFDDSGWTDTFYVIENVV